MDKTEITNKLKTIIEKSDDCGFEVYLMAKNDPRLKKLSLSKTNLRQDLKADILNVIQDVFLADEIIFSSAENVADNQNVFYVIQQTDEYKPFDVSAWETEEFNESHLNGFMGFMFRFRYDEQIVWCYQNRRSTTLTNYRKTSLIARLSKYENGWTFEKQNESLVNFAHAIDILIIDGNLITKDIGLLERSFDFQSFIHQKAQEAANSVAESHLFSGIDKMKEYLASDVKHHKPYKKKMLKALDSPVLQMEPNILFEKISTLPRWKGRFKQPDDGMIPLETNKEIESMIDLLIERFTVSEVTGQEYDTEVKKKADEVIKTI